MATLSRQRLRIALGRKEGALVDKITGLTPDFWRKQDIQFEFSSWYSTTLLSVANIATIYLKITPAADRDGTPVLSGHLHTVDFDDTLTEATWNDGTKQHALIPFTATETIITVTSNQTEYWLCVYAETTDDPARTIVLDAGIIYVSDAGLT